MAVTSLPVNTQGGLHMRKLLIVDDEIDICHFVKSFFKERHFIAHTALSGNEALRILRRERPDIILLDVRMKGMDGMETLKKIREISEDVKVIMVTAVNDKKTRQKAERLGVSKYITKPLMLEDLEVSVISSMREV